MSNIHGLGSAPKKDDKKNNMEEFAVGGGQSVVRPTTGAGRASDPQDPISDVISRARDFSQRQGAGPHPAMDKNVALITVYKNGFVIGDSPFRDLSAPENKAFLDDLKNGVVPRELEPEVHKNFANAREVGVSLIDKTSETFVPPKPKFDFSKSQGMSLGGVSSASAAANFSGASPAEIKVDDSKPTTTIQIVLSNRQRIKQIFNLDHTVLDLYRHILFVSKLAAPFSLIVGFPPKPLSNPHATIKEAGLAGSSVEQRVDKK